MGINYNRLVIQERRQKIWTLITRGMKGYEIAKVLGVDPATVSRDIAYLAHNLRIIWMIWLNLPCRLCIRLQLKAFAAL